ncbi:MAG: sulfatase-like hydrolase/transferase [Alphaproteobacteria bacterium]|nr:sulfatase-like hydrolase/transferase [Alphaproteobacteria bacterium]
MADRPSFVLFCTDQQRADSLGCYGNALARTPNIDAVAARGVRFGDHLTPNQICSPSRGTMITGRYPRHHGMTTNGRTMHAGLVTLPGRLSQAGYSTHAVGKLHLQPIMADRSLGYPESVPFWQAGYGAGWNGPYFGYDTVDFMIGESLLATEAGHYAQWLRSHHPEAVALYQPEAALDRPLADLDEAWTSGVPDALHYNTWIADRAIEFLARAEPPFLLFVSTPDPHHPFSPPRPWSDLLDAASIPAARVVPGELERMPDYVRVRLGADWIDNDAAPVEQGGMTVTDTISPESLARAVALTRGMEAQIDHQFGRVLAKLDAMGFTDETIVVFTSDHGEFLGHHGLLHKGPPPYGDLCRVGFVMAGPGIPGGECSPAPSSHLDIAPTLLELAGIDSPGARGDGESLVPVLRGGHLRRRERFLEFHPRIDARVYNHSIVADGWRLTLYPAGDPHWGELFDLEADPGEHRNLFNDIVFRARRDRLAERLVSCFPARPDAGTALIAKW